MRRKILSIGFILFLVPTLFVYFMPKESIRIEDVAVLQKNTQTTIGLPVRLKIPALHVDAPIIPVGLTSNGEMGTPKGPSDVAWFNLGPRPGERGNAVIDGHYNWINNIPAVFDSLHTLKKGDKIFIENEYGVTTTFVVLKIQTYDKDADASNIFISVDDKAHLNLITCTGVWNKSKKTYSKRLVIFTDKE